MMAGAGLPPRGPANPEFGGVSVVFPVFNESFIIEQTIRNYYFEFQGRVQDFEFIVAEDGSTDDTKNVLERLAGDLPIRLYTSDERKGYQKAVIDAVAHATKPWVFIVDSDYQFAVIDFWRLEPHRDQADIILGIKSPRKDPFYRVWLSAIFNWLLRLFFHVPYRDMDTGFRLIRKQALDEIAPQIRHLAFFTAEFVVRADYAGYRIKEVPVHHYARKIGSTTIFFISKLAWICLEQFLALIRMKQEFAQRDLKSRPTKSRA
jgi:glycosyltransferase involved in cell wall biosynthesis